MAYITHNPLMEIVYTTYREDGKDFEYCFHINNESYCGNEWYEETYLDKIINDLEQLKEVRVTHRNSYQAMIIDYYNTQNPEYLIGHPEFKDYFKYLKLSEINTIRYNKEKLLNLVKEKQLLSKVFSEISETTFIPSKELKKLFETLFKKYNITNISPKASLITSCNFLTAKAITRMYNNKSTKGYSIAKSEELRFNI